MPLKISIDPNKVGLNVMDAWKKGLAVLSEEILADCNQCCKVDNTGLRSSAEQHSRPAEGILIWDTVYAKRQYYEIKTALTPGTTWKWCETAKLKHKSEWIDTAQKLMRENL